MSECDDAFKRGLQILNDKGELSAAEAVLKVSIESSILDLRRRASIAVSSSSPWHLARPVVNEHFTASVRSTWCSSSWVILAAHEVRTVILVPEMYF